MDGTTDASPVHKNKCIRVNYQAGYNIDLPVLVFDKEVDEHPQLAVRDDGFCDDDPKEFVEYCTSHDVGKNNLHNQKHRMVRYLKAWCDNVRDSMPSGVSMTVMTMNHYMYNERDDVALKFLLVAMESALKLSFACYMLLRPVMTCLRTIPSPGSRRFWTVFTLLWRMRKRRSTSRTS